MSSAYGVVQGACYAERNSSAAYGGTYADTTTSTSRYKVMFSANRSSSIYGASETVQPPALQIIPQIKY